MAEREEYLGMSDDDFLNANPAEMEDWDNLEPEASDEEVVSEVEEESVGEADDDSDETEETTDEVGAAEDTESDEPEEEAGDGEEGLQETEEEVTSEEETKEVEEEKKVETNFEEFFQQVTGEFKANGKAMKVDNPDDIIRLMQMGANYNRKMAALKPSMKVLKMLEKNELLSEEKLSYLIDLNQKRPEAIAKLLADSKIDPLDVNLEGADNYKAGDYSVDDREVALDEVVEELKETPTFNKTIRVVSNEWDSASKQAVADAPDLLRVLNDQMANGIYDLISTEIQQERMLGRLDGMSDIEAYQAIGDSINARGGFDHLGPQKTETPAPKQDAKSQAIKQEQDKKRRDKRRAASPSKPAAPSTKKDDFNPLGMSDAEYMKQFDESLL